MTNNLENSGPLSSDEALMRLRNGASSPQEIARAIAWVAKPFDKIRFETAKPVVAELLHHPDAVVRHEAIWFLGSWGKETAFVPALIQIMQNDSDIWNRAYAARCVGNLSRTGDSTVVGALLQVVRDTEEEDDVRTSAYGALLLAVNGANCSGAADDFQIWHSKGTRDIDQAWLDSLGKH
jgi:HEAT repeat protein